MSFNRPLYDFCEGKKKLQESTEAANYNIQTPVICGNCLPSDPRIMPNRTGVSLNSGVDWRFYAGPVDVESDLFNLNRVASRCPTSRYHPNAKNCMATHQGQPAGAGVISQTRPDMNAPNAGQYSNVPIYKNGAKGYRQVGDRVVEGFEAAAPEGTFRKNGQRCTDNNLVDMPSCSFNTEDTRLSNPVNSLRGTGINRFQPLCFNPQEKIFFGGEKDVSTRLVFRDNWRPCVPSLDVISRPPLPPAADLPAVELAKVSGVNVKPLYIYDNCG